MIDRMVVFAMCALLPGGSGLPALADCGVQAHVIRLRRESTWFFWLGVVLGSLVFVITPILTVYRPLPAFWLSDDALDRHADAIARTPIYVLRQAIFLLKTAAGLCWGADPAVRAAFAMAPYGADPGTWRST